MDVVEGAEELLYFAGYALLLGERGEGDEESMKCIRREAKKTNAFTTNYFFFFKTTKHVEEKQHAQITFGTQAMQVILNADVIIIVPNGSTSDIPTFANEQVTLGNSALVKLVVFE